MDKIYIIYLQKHYQRFFSENAVFFSEASRLLRLSTNNPRYLSKITKYHWFYRHRNKK